MSDTDKDGGDLPHAVFRLADAQRDRAKAENKKADAITRLCDALVRLVNWFIKTKE